MKQNKAKGIVKQATEFVSAVIGIGLVVSLILSVGLLVKWLIGLY